MGTCAFWRLSVLSDQELEFELNSLLTRGARVEAHIVAHLAEVEERRLHLKAACSSLFDYCLRRLRLSESEAFHRITAARLARKFPVIFQLLEARSIHLSALRLLRDHLTDENHRELLAAASGKSKREVEMLVAALAPRPDVPSRLRKLPELRRAPLDLLSVAAVPSTALGPAPASASASALGTTPAAPWLASVPALTHASVPVPVPAPAPATRSAAEIPTAASTQASRLAVSPATDRHPRVEGQARTRAGPDESCKPERRAFIGRRKSARPTARKAREAALGADFATPRAAEKFPENRATSARTHLRTSAASVADSAATCSAASGPYSFAGTSFAGTSLARTGSA